MPARFAKSIVYGPIHSRRLGISLGLNILPVSHKLCNFNCVYCECGWNPKTMAPDFPAVADFARELEAALGALRQEGVTPDVLTFSGNGEPTLHPQFGQIIDVCLALRDAYFPDARVCVLSNGTRLHLPEVVEALRKADQRILKLDAPFEDLAAQINLPVGDYSVERVARQLQVFDGDFTLQTLFLKGRHLGRSFDNTTPEALEAWTALVARLRPRQVMVYTLDRSTPERDLEKIPVGTLQAIAQRVRGLGIEVQVAG